MALFAPLMAYVFGQYLTNEAQSDALKEKQRRAREGRERQTANRREARERTSEATEQFNPEQRQTRVDTGTQETRDILDRVLSEASASSSVPSSTGRISEEVLNTRANDARARMDKASTIAAFLSKLGGYDAGGLGEKSLMREQRADQTSLGAKGGRMAATDQLLVDAVQPDRLQMLLGGLASQAGLTLASADIMSALAAPGAGTAATTAGANVYPSADPQVYGNWLGGSGSGPQTFDWMRW